MTKMPWWRRLFGSGAQSPKDIRKDDTELRLEDYARFPVWEYALDEEGKADQSETTMRPVDPIPSNLDANFFGIVAIEMRFADGTVHWGLMGTPQGPEDLWRADCQMWLPESARVFAQQNAPPKHNCILNPDDLLLLFMLPDERKLPSTEAQRLIALVYDALGTTRERMWPMLVTPRARIAGLPQSWKMPGWRRFAKNEQDSEIVN